MALTRLVDYNIDGAAPFFVAVVGSGPCFDTLLRFIKDFDIATIFPKLRLVGWVPDTHPIPSDLPAFFLSCPRFDDIASLFAACPNVKAVFDISPDSRHMPAIRALAPLAASVVASREVLGFCAALQDGRLAIDDVARGGRAQKLLGLMVEQIDGDMIILDENGVVLDVNHHAAKSRGLLRADMIGQPCAVFDLAGPCCLLGTESPFVLARQSGKVAEHTFDHTLESGFVRCMYTVCMPVVDAFGGPTHYLYISRDVTEQQRLHRLLEIQENDAALGRFTRYLAHEIRNPLFAIGGFANSLYRNESLDNSAREKIRVIIEESRRLDEILSKIINFSKPAEQTIENFAPEDAVRLSLDAMLPDGGAALGESGLIAVELDLESDLPKVRGNINNVRDSLNNMVKNSLEAMPNGGVISISVKRDDLYVQIEVKDTGEGIPYELQDQVFNPFLSTKQGMGLGLAMSRKLIEEMGGKVVLKNSSDKGTTISMFMPVALVVDDNAQGRNAEMDNFLDTVFR